GEVEAETDLLRRLGLLLQPVVRGLNDLAPSAGGLRHSLDVLGRLAIVEVFAEGVDAGVEGLVLVVELLLEDARDAPEEIRSVGRLGACIKATEIELDERLPALASGVELLELEERLVMGGLDLEDLLPRERRLVGLFCLLAPQLGDLPVLFDLVDRILE